MLASTLTTGLLALSSLIFAHPSPQTSRAVTLPLPTKTIYQFPNTTWIESIATRSNGHLLLSILGPPEIYSLDPSAATPLPTLLATIPDVTGLLGLTEVSPDLFAVVAGNLTTVHTGIPNSFSIWIIDFNICNSTSPLISKAADVPSAGLLNGLAPLPGIPNTILAADSILGAVWKLDIVTGENEIVIQIPEMLAGPALVLGINGLRVRDGYLYFTNSGSISFSRVAINSNGTVAPGAAVELLATGDTLFDDFAFDDAGTAWINTNTGNTIVAVGQDGVSETVAGGLDQLTLAGGTDAVFGRGADDGGILYVGTSGGGAAPINGTVSEPGKVVAVDTTGFSI